MSRIGTSKTSQKKSGWKDIIQSGVYHVMAGDSWYRFQQSGKQEDLDYTIAFARSALDFLPDAHPAGLDSLFDLAYYLRERYDRWWRMEDLVEAILFYRAFLTVCPEDHPDQPDSLSNLASSLHIRYQQSGQSEDLEESIELDRAALILRPEGHPDRSHSLGNLASSLYFRYQQSGRSEDLEESIELHRAALILRPEGHPVRYHSLGNLASSLRIRYKQGGQSEDLEESIELDRAALTLCPKGHPDRSISLGGLALSLRYRYELSGRSEDLEESIELDRTVLTLRPEGHPDRSISLGNLANSLRIRYQQSGQSEDLEESIELHRAALILRPEGRPDRSHSLGNLASSLYFRYQQSGRSEALEEAIELDRAALILCPEGHPDRSISLGNLAISLRIRYKQSRKSEALEEAIELDRAALALCPEGHPRRTSALEYLTHSLFSQYEHLGYTNDFEECMHLLQQAAGHRFSSSLDRLRAARRWADLARSHDHETTLTAYRETMLLFQQAFTVNPTLHAQHDFLIRNQMHGASATEAASFAIEKNELGQAVEMLEQGRTLLWSQMRGFRTPLDRLAETNGELVERFRNVGRQLEELATFSDAELSKSNASLSHNIQSGRESFDKMIVRQRKLTEEQEKLVDGIRQVPGFEDFLKVMPFETLKQVALEGPVIVINYCKYRCDALIIMPAGHGLPIACIPLDNDFFNDSWWLCQDLVETRMHDKPGSLEYDEKLRESMEMIWDRVVSKVVDKLKELGIVEGSRIWWCPTSVLSVLPFHAAGPYRGADGTMKYLIDDYISSYTPTLGALINARSPGTGCDPEILIVADTKSLDSTAAEVNAIRQRTRIYDIPPKLLRDDRAMHKVVTKSLQKATWVHFACHGHLDKRPFDSAFKLFDGGLTLLDIIKANLPNAEFAFLSACHTAEQPHSGAYDEVLHLAAAMQFSGFRSVIGTMWELYDRDGPSLAKGVYEYLAEGEEKEGRYKRAAAGLREAVVTLKAKKGIPTERWVNMIHIGA